MRVSVRGTMALDADDTRKDTRIRMSFTEHP
jgi:hypothetical protein